MSIETIQSRAGEAYFAEAQRMAIFISYISDLILRPWNRQDQEFTDEENQTHQRIFGSTENAKAQRFQQLEVLAELTICRAVDNFDCYLADLIELIYTHKPKAVSHSMPTISTSLLFEHENLDDARKAILMQVVQQWSHAGVDALERHFKKDFKFNLFATQNQKQQYNRLNQWRNLIVHRRGHVDAHYLAKAQVTNLSEGERISFGLEGASGWHNFIVDMTRDIDQRALIHFSLPPINH